MMNINNVINEIKMVNEPIILMMIGIPGSGKSTVANQISEETGAVWLSADEIRVEINGDADSQDNPQLVFKTMKERMQAALASGKSVIYDATNCRRRYRRDFINDANKNNQQVAAIYMDVPTSVCIQRNEQRDRKVPIEVIERMAQRLTPPSKGEGFCKIFNLNT